MIPKKVSNLLDKNKIKYKELKHKKVYTGRDKANTLKIKKSLVMKTVVLKADRQYLIVTVPCEKIIDIQKAKKILSSKEKKIKKVGFAKEKWIKENLKGIKTGSIPPFGLLWKIDTMIDRSVLRAKKAVFNSGNHYFSIEMDGNVLKKVVPDLITGDFTKKKKGV